MIRRTFPRTVYTPKPKSFLYTPIEFRIKHPHPYPDDNKHEFERWFYDNTMPEEITGRTYLPVFWTAYWVANGYATKEKARNNLQRFIDSLPRDKRYFTICQYDDGPIIDFKDLDIIVFGMSGGRIDYPIPLLCQPHGYKFDCKRDIFASFVGADTHPIRKKLIKQFTGKPDCHVTLKKLPLKEYCNLMARSKFALCPRGYGKSSFRIMEAIHFGAIPVYVSDEFVQPYNQSFPGLVAHHEIDIYAYLKEFSSFELLEKLYQQVQGARSNYTYEGCRQKIIQEVNK